jgi:hypothetical protein
VPVETVLQPGYITLRHVKLGTGPGQVTVLGNVFVPNSTGLIGRRGFQAGNYELRVNEEGGFQLTFPNSVGEDGVLHRDRFLIISLGKRTASVNIAGQVVYSGGTYHPGDEWIEVYHGDNPEPLYVGTPTQAVVRRESIELRGYDAFWLSKKSRETLGWWNHAPRDIFNFYSQSWSYLAAETFPEGYGAGWQGGALNNGRVSWVRAATAGNKYGGRPGTIKLYPRDTSTTSQLTAVATTDYNRDSNVARRISCTIVNGYSLGTNPFRIGFSTTNFAGYGFYMDILHLGIDTRRDVTLASSGYAATNVKCDLTFPIEVAVEVRGRWVYYYFKGKLIGFMPTPVAAADPSTAFIIFVTDATSGIRQNYVEIANFTVKETVPFLQRGSEVSDYHLPGAPVVGGLHGQYFSDKTHLEHGTGDLNYWDRLLMPNLEPQAERIDAAMEMQGDDADDLPRWLPEGVTKQNVSVRWTGSVYLDLANYDYKFQTVAADRARAWVGQTTFGAELIEDWGAAHDMTASGASNALKANRNFPAVAGWYPAVVEANSSAARFGLRFDWKRTTWATNSWAPVGGPDFYKEVYADSPDGFWRMCEPDTGTSAVRAFGAASSNGTPNGMTREANLAMPGPFPGTKAILWTGDGMNVTFGDIAAAEWSGTSPFSFECWFSRPSNDTDRFLFSKVGNGEQCSCHVNSAGTVTFRRYVGSVAVAATVSGVLANNHWHHMVGTYDGSQLICYLDGVAGTPVNDARSMSTNAAGFEIGSSASTNYWRGHICCFATYDTALSAARVAAHYDGAYTYSEGAASPQGVIRGLKRLESHYDLMKSVTEESGCQFTTTPRRLEHGAFPGEVALKVRVGRETEKTIDSMEAQDMGLDINAEEIADVIVGEGTGITTEPQGALLSEAINHVGLQGNHLIPMIEYEAFTDIDFLPALQARVNALLALRGSAWEQVSAAPRGHRELLDTFPLAGQLAEFKWQPGDSVRLDLPEIGVFDVTPRQLLAVSWPFVPGGLQRPSVSFRQRPRNLAQYLRRLQHQGLQPHRYYQGQIVTLTGSWAQRNAGGGVDEYSRISAPDDLSTLVRLEFVVAYKADTSSWTVNLNGTSLGYSISRPGRFDITRNAVGKTNVEGRLYGSLSGGTGACEYQIVAHYRV